MNASYAESHKKRYQGCSKCPTETWFATFHVQPRILEDDIGFLHHKFYATIGHLKTVLGMGSKMYERVERVNEFL